MKIFDSHLHLDFKEKNLEVSLKKLHSNMKKLNISNAFLIHMDNYAWDEYDFIKYIDRYYKDIFYKYILLKPNNEDIRKLNIIHKKIDGIKLHPRLGEYSLKNKQLYNLLKKVDQCNLNVIIDAFPDGNSLISGFNVKDYADLAIQFPNINFIWAHMGGVKIFEFLLVAKRLNNVFLDFSYSLLYFKESSIEEDIVFAFNSLKYEKIMFGSDFPDRSLDKTLKEIKKIFKKHKLKQKNINKLMYHNAIKFNLLK
jgi:predicted TIM-barrel fold metal-dependent hydrolase